jgi:hypothetical protein
MFGLSIKNMEVSNITIDKTKGKYISRDALDISAEIKFEYKGKSETLKFIFYTYDAMIFGFCGALDHNHVEKAEFIINKINKKTRFIKSIIERRYKGYLRSQDYSKTEEELLKKFKPN